MLILFNANLLQNVQRLYVLLNWSRPSPCAYHQLKTTCTNKVPSMFHARAKVIEGETLPGSVLHIWQGKCSSWLYDISFPEAVKGIKTLSWHATKPSVKSRILLPVQLPSRNWVRCPCRRFQSITLSAISVPWTIWDTIRGRRWALPCWRRGLLEHFSGGSQALGAFLKICWNASQCLCLKKVLDFGYSAAGHSSETASVQLAAHCKPTADIDFNF